MKLKFSEKLDNEKRAVYIDESPEPDYSVEEDELQELLKEARYGHWSDDSQKGIELGQKLYNLLNRNSGQIQQAVDEYTKSKRDLYFHLTLPSDLTEIPFELLYDQEFLSLKPNIHFIRSVDEKSATIPKENRPLKVLFIAASPIDLEHATLQFEQEEDLIFKVTEKYPLNFQVEDTGSLAGIEQMLYEIQGTDILHISGHAGHDAELGPVFYMEDELGNLDKVTPVRLFKYIKDSNPKLLFLSGCSTGKSDKNIGVESFAYQMVQLGVPYVLSWGLPVSDKGATAFAAVIYEKLAKGNSIVYAIQEARTTVKEKYHPWPLMRLFSDGTKCEALVEEGQKTIRKSSRQTTHKNLKGSNVQILDKGFVGRRRELQKALTVLRNRKPYENKCGMIIRGPAGVGKSCLAGHIFERQSIYDIFILRGELDRKIIIYELKKYFDKQGYQKALGILGSDLTYEEKIKELYRTIFKEKNIILYFDDFEDNLELQKNTWYLKPKFINNFRPFLQYIDFADNQSKIVITSRYVFDLQSAGENLSRKFLLEIPLMSFRGSDENKKLNELEHIIKSSNIELYKKFGHGNPRLMDWLDKIAAAEEKYNLDELQKALEGKEEDYIRKYLAEIMARAEGTEFWQFLQMAAVYRLPVPADAFEKFGGKKLLERGVDLTLFEKEAVLAKEKRYWVMPVIRQQMLQQLSSEQQQMAHRTALTWYDKFLEDKEIIPYHNEALYLALAVNEIDLAAKHVIPIGNELNRLLYYQEQKEILEGVRSRLTKKLISDAKKNKQQSVSTLLNQYANLLTDLGDAKKAVEYLEQGLEIDLAVFGDKHPNVAIRYNNLGLAYKALGDAKKAVEYYEQALKIDLAVFGDKHPNVAIRYNNLGEAYRALGDAKKAVEYYEQALEIVNAVYGKTHPYVASTYNNLGGAYQDLGDAKKALEYFEQALKIDLAVFGDKHPKVATRYNNLGSAYQDLGDAKKAVEYYEQALKIDLAVFGDKHPNVITDYLRLATIYKTENNNKKELEYLLKVFEIFKTASGEEHENTLAIKKRIQELQNIK